MNLKSLFKFDIKQDNKKFSIKELRTYVNKELFGIKNDKTEVPIEFNLGTIDMNNENIYILVIRDFTERYEVDRVKNEFVSIVSHELRTPLTSIKASLELALTGVLGTVPDKMHEVLDIAHSNSKRLNFLINDILDINKISQGKIDFDFKNLPLLPIIEETIEQNLDYAKQYNVGIEIKDGISDDIIVTADKNRLIQILVNLISNAIKFSHNGGNVHIYVEEKERSVIINVQDYGIGIPEHAQNKIFKKFSQVDSSSTRAKGGTGLGLYINKMLVERMNGKISFVSEENKGSTFSVEVPKAL
jgi:signal transduction histidine kinase